MDITKYFSGAVGLHLFKFCKVVYCEICFLQTTFQSLLLPN